MPPAARSRPPPTMCEASRRPRRGLSYSHRARLRRGARRGSGAEEECWWLSHYTGGRFRRGCAGGGALHAGVSGRFRRLWSVTRLQRQFAVRTKTDELEDIGAALAVDEYEIGPDVTVATALPYSRQGVVAVPGIWWLVVGERTYDSAESGVDRMPMMSFVFSAVVAFELTGQPDPSSRRHGRRAGRRTIPRRSRRCRGRRGWRRRWQPAWWR